MKKFLAILLAMCMVFSLAACSSSSSSSDTADDDTDEAEETVELMDISSSSDSTESDIVDLVNVGITADPQDLSPWAANTTGRISVIESIYQRMAITDGFGGELIGVLMKDYTQIDDVTYQIEIYDYIYDTDGNHMTASDVVFSYETAIELGNSTKLGAIESISVVSDYVVEMVLTADSLGTFQAMMTEIPIVTEAAYVASGDGMTLNPVGTGPYVVTEYVSGSTLTLEKTNNYWQTDESLTPYYYQANAEKIVYYVITDSNSMTIAMANGTIDVTSGIQSSDVDKFDTDGEYSDGITVDYMLDNRCNNLLFNCSDDSVCSNVLVRQAICYALDTAAMAEAIYGSLATEVYTFGNSKYSDYNEDWETDGYYEYDLDAAQALIDQYLEETGETGITLTLTCTSGTESNNYCVLIKEFLEMVDGIDEVELELLEEAQVNEIVATTDGWDLSIGGTGSTDYIVNLWIVIFDPDTWTYGSKNFVQDETLYELLDIACSTDGHTQENVDAAHQYLEDNAYVYGLYSKTTAFVHTDTITSIVTSAKGFLIPGACTYSVSE